MPKTDMRSARSHARQEPIAAVGPWKMKFYNRIRKEAAVYVAEISPILFGAGAPQMLR